MTRNDLGVVIAANLARFIEVCPVLQILYAHRPHCASQKTQCYPVAREQVRWRVGSKGIRFEHLLLVALWNPSGNTWQADLAVDMRSTTFSY
jgi:hypothetical protein